MALKSGRVGIHPSQVDPITGMLLSSPGGASDLSDLGDVDISNPEAGQILEYNATSEKWENVFASISPVTPATLASLQDVMLTDLQDGDFISYDATAEKWVNVGEAPAPSYIDKTITIYSAVEDLISFTDAAGITHTEQLAIDQSSKQITFKINPTGDTPITFTSSIAKDPDNLSNYYSKTVNINSSTTEVYLMPNDNVLYWWGYESSDLEDMSTANGWALPSSQYFVNPTHNKNYIECNASGSGTPISGVGTKNGISAIKAYAIGEGLTIAYNEYYRLRTFSAKNNTSALDTTSISTSALQKSEISISGTVFLSFQSAAGSKGKLNALLYE